MLGKGMGWAQEASGVCQTITLDDPDFERWIDITHVKWSFTAGRRLHMRDKTARARQWWRER